MKFKLFGTEIYISFLFFAMITVMIVFDKTGLIVPTLFSVICHEAGHLFCMWAMGNTPKRIKLIPASVQITDSITSRYKTDNIVSLCGPLVNILLFLVFYINYSIWGNITTLIFAFLNLILGLFNLLPVKGLDGGRILHNIIAQKRDIARADLILKFSGLLFSVVLIILALILHIKGKLNLSIYILGIYFLVLSLSKK